MSDLFKDFVMKIHRMFTDTVPVRPKIVTRVEIYDSDGNLKSVDEV